MPSAFSILTAKVEAALQKGELQTALEELARFPDLRYSELPKVDNKLWQPLSKDQQAMRAMALGVASPHLSVRRFCKKYLPKTGAVAGETLALLTLESVHPSRPVPEYGEGSLGSFGGYASPVGQHIADNKLSYVVKPPAAYSPAGKYAKEIVTLLVEILGTMPFALWMPLVEYHAAHYRAGFDLEKPPTPPPWVGKEESYSLVFELFELEQRIEQLARAPQPELLETLTAWAHGRILSMETTTNRVAKRVGELLPAMSECDRFCAGRKLRRLAASSLLALGQVRPLIFRELQRAMTSLDDREKKVLDIFYFKEFREARPAEWAAMESAGTAPTPTTTAAYLPPGQGGAVAAKIETQVANLARMLGLRQLWLDIWYADPLNVKYIGRPPADDIPNQCDYAQAAADAALLNRLLELGKEYTKSALHGRAFPHRAAVDLVPNETLEAMDCWEPLSELLARALAEPLTVFRKRYADGSVKALQDCDPPCERTKLLPRDICGAILFGLMMLPPRLNWEAQVLRMLDGLAVHMHGGFNFLNGMEALVDLLEMRRILPMQLIERLVADWTPMPIQSCWWQELIALLYSEAGDEGRALSLRLLSKVTLPERAEDPDYKRHAYWYPSFQWTLTRAWKQADYELWQVAFERFLVPYVLQGKTPHAPQVEAVDFRSQANATLCSTNGIPLQQIWAAVMVRSRPHLAAMVETALRRAEHFEICRTTLRLICDTMEVDNSPFRGRLPQVLELIESAQGPVQLCGLQVLEADAGTAQPDVKATLRALERCAASTVSGVLQSTASTLVSLAAEFPDAYPDIVRLLIGLLSYETPSILSHTLQSVSKLVEKKAVPSLLRNDLRQRVEELRERDPKRFGKVAQKILIQLADKS